MLTRIAQFATKIQSVAGTPETLTATDVRFEVADLSPSYDRNLIERDNLLRTSLSKRRRIPGMAMGTISGRAELVGSGDATPPPIVGLLAMSAVKLIGDSQSIDLTGAPTGTFIPGEKITDGGTKIGRFIKMLDSDTMLYVEVSGTAFANGDTITGALSAATADPAATENITVLGKAYAPGDPETGVFHTSQANKDGLLYKIHDARSTFTLEAEAGGIGYINFTETGIGIKPADAAPLTGFTLPAVDPEPFLSAELTVDGDLLCVGRFSLDPGNQVDLVPCANAASGYTTAVIGDRVPTISIDPLAELEATVDFFGKYDAGTLFGFYCQIGQTTGQRFAICAPRAQYTELPEGDRVGRRTYEATLLLTEGSDSDDEYLIATF